MHRKLKNYLDRVIEKQEPAQVILENGEDIILLPKSSYDAMLETYYLLKSPKNAEHLLRGIQQYEKGKKRC